MTIPQRGKRLISPLVLGLALCVAPAATTAAVPAAEASACETAWGSLVKKRAPYTGKQITDVRSGRHECFDRLVIDFKGSGRRAPGYQVEYVARVTEGGSGARVALRGGARLRIIVKAPAYDDDGNLTYQPASRQDLADVTGYETFRQVAWAGSYEGQTTIGLGVRARLPMHAFVLRDNTTGRHRLVIDVAHTWS